MPKRLSRCLESHKCVALLKLADTTFNDGTFADQVTFSKAAFEAVASYSARAS